MLREELSMRTREQPPRAALVLHHDRWVRAHLADQLRMAGYGVLAASNGFSGLRLAEQQQPGVILLSPALPELSGGEVLDHLRAGSSTRDTPALIVDDTQGARAAGPAVLPRPTGVGPLAHMEQALVHGGRTGAIRHEPRPA